MSPLRFVISFWRCTTCCRHDHAGGSCALAHHAFARVLLLPQSFTEERPWEGALTAERISTKCPPHKCTHAPPCPPSAHRFAPFSPRPLAHDAGGSSTPSHSHRGRVVGRYHEHLQLAGESLKEHLLLPVTVRVGILPPTVLMRTPIAAPRSPIFYSTCILCADDGPAGDAPERRAPPLEVTPARIT